MQRIDGSYLYDLGHRIHPLGGILPTAKYGEILAVLFTAQQALRPFLTGSVFRLRYSYQHGQNLLAWVDHLVDKALGSDLVHGVVDPNDISNMKMTFASIETTMASEFSLMDTYLVAKKGGYDTADLIDNGGNLFQASLGVKVPAALKDVQQATRCIAFEVPTAAGFHLHRANESVLVAYFQAVRGEVPLPTERNMGVLLSTMEKHKLGDERVRAALKDIKNLHRNPLIHPEHSLETIDEALDLLGAIRAAMGAMLPTIPEPGGPLLNQMFAEPPIAAAPSRH